MSNRLGGLFQCSMAELTAHNELLFLGAEIKFQRSKGNPGVQVKAARIIDELETITASEHSAQVTGQIVSPRLKLLWISNCCRDEIRPKLRRWIEG